MCNSMPVGSPRLIDSNSYTDSFFGFVDCTVKSPINEYIGLLPVKWQGKLVCPGVTLTDLEGHFNTFPLD
uniref:Plasmid related DNA polymerase n=1 Tax=Rhizophagus sp. DAOM 213198 TaxID=1417302 RepID=A0A0A7AMS8_9GLOM|nr:plasmid related DNA polymerase [Rhizophagus sp. DAOM 213198]